MKTLIGIFFFAWTGIQISFAQCTNQVMHVSGTQVVNDVEVTVTSDGTVDVLNYCEGVTNPYFIGYTYSDGSSGNGRYTFTFNPAVSGVTLNFGGTSNVVESGQEEVKLVINGTHYAMTEVGAGNPCESLAILTGEGNLAGCVECSVSGWNGTTINETISSIAVVDTVLSGMPAGTVFSIFICDAAVVSTPEEDFSDPLQVFPNPSDSEVRFTTHLDGNHELILYDHVGREVAHQQFGLSFALNVSQFAKGIYRYSFLNNGFIISSGNILVE